MRQLKEHSTARKTDWITFASVVSCVAVVVLHTNGCFWSFSATALWWKTANIIESVFYFAVPVFFMISGSTLLDFYKRYGLRRYFEKRIAKTFVPYLFWSLANIVCIVVIGRVALSEVTPAWVLSGLGGGSFPSIYWFFIPLFSIYLSVPLFAAVSDERKKDVYTYVAVAGFIFCCALPFVADVLGIPYATTLTVGVGAGYLLFLPVGWLLSHCELTAHVKGGIYLLGFVGLVLHVVGTYVLSMEAGDVVDTFKGYTNLPCVMYSVAMFVLLKDVGTRVMKVASVGRFVRFLGGYTLAIYLLHWYGLQVAGALPFLSTYSIIYRLFGCIPIVAVVVGVTWLLRKVPFMRKVLP